MKNNYLLPAKFKKIGMCLAIPFVLACLWLLFVPGAWDYNLCNIPVLSVIGDGGLENSMFNIIETDPLDEIAMRVRRAVLGEIKEKCEALSKEKDEDEMTPVERQNAFVWSFWVTAVLYTLGIITIYGISFLSYSFVMPYIFFTLYIIKFNLSMHKLRRNLK